MKSRGRKADHPTEGQIGLQEKGSVAETNESDILEQAIDPFEITAASDKFKIPECDFNRDSEAKKEVLIFLDKNALLVTGTESWQKAIIIPDRRVKVMACTGVLLALVLLPSGPSVMSLMLTCILTCLWNMVGVVVAPLL